MKEKLICPICNKEYKFAIKTYKKDDGTWGCAHDDDVISQQDKIAIKRHRNADLSHEALKLAAEAKRRDAEMEERKEVIVTSTQPDKSRGKSFRVPLKVVESIKEKVASAPETE